MEKLQQSQIPKKVYELSENMRIIRYRKLVTGNPWKNITGKLEIGKKINIEKMLKERGFEDVSEYF